MALVLASLALLALAGYLMVFHMEPVKSRYAQHRYEMEMIRTGEYQHTSYEHFTSLRRIVSWKNSLDLIRKHPCLERVLVIIRNYSHRNMPQRSNTIN